MFDPVDNRRNLRDEIRETLRGAVVSGELRPGAIYSARTLAEQFGVSSTPVREAMLDLAKEGHVQIVRNKGFRVTELSSAQLDDITQVRELLEVPAVRSVAAAGVDPDVSRRLQDLARAISDAAQQHDLSGFVAADLKFHLAVIDLAGNPELVEIVRSLRARSRLFGLQSLDRANGLLKSALEHAELARLIAARDADGAERLMRHHLGHVRGIWAQATLDPSKGLEHAGNDATHG